MTEKRRRIIRRKKIKKWLINVVVWPLAALFGVAALIALLPVLLPALAVAGWFSDRQKRAAAIRFRCTVCGVPLGEAALALADGAYAAYWERLHREHPGVHFRTVRTLDAICPHCGQRYTYVEKERTFTKEAEEAQDGQIEAEREWDGQTENEF